MIRVQRHLLNRDGLHLSPDGIRTMLQDILDSVDTLWLSYIDSDAVYDSLDRLSPLLVGDTPLR